MAILCLSPNVDSSATPTHRFRLLASGSPAATAPPADEPTLIASACQASYLWLPPAKVSLKSWAGVESVLSQVVPGQQVCSHFPWLSPNVDSRESLMRLFWALVSDSPVATVSPKLRAHPRRSDCPGESGGVGKRTHGKVQL
jgi:hypothetical protein